MKSKLIKLSALLGAVVILAALTVPYYSACSCISKSDFFYATFDLPRSVTPSTQQMTDAMKAKLEGANLAEKESKNNWSVKDALLDACPKISDSDKDQQISCTFWLESNGILERGWTVRFTLKPEKTISNVSVRKAYDLTESKQPLFSF